MGFTEPLPARIPLKLERLSLEIERRIYTRLRARADRKLALRATRDPDPAVRPKPAHLLTGERGEDAAFFHLRGLGYTIVARRWRSPRLSGDLDLVAWDGPTLVIFEVKTRTARDLMPAEVAVDPHKKTILRKMAAAYLSQLPELHRTSIPLRFDVLSVYLLPSGIEFEHLPVAFSASETPRRGV